MGNFFGWTSPSLSTLARTRDGAKNNFNAIRLIAACLVLVSHSFPLTGDKTAIEPLALWTRGQATLGALSVTTFFFVSGFLVSRSFIRNKSVLAFCAARIFRIIPGLAVAVIFCAVVLGPLTTTLSPPQYFKDPAFRSYFWNILLSIHYVLPGVFSNNPNTAVNGSLWTLEFEVWMYIVLPFALINERAAKLLLPLLLLLLIAAHEFWIISPARDIHLYYYVFLGQFFILGAIAYLYRDFICFNRLVVALCMAAIFAAGIYGEFFLIWLLAGSYVLLWLAYCAPKFGGKLVDEMDLSYGVYIYAFPVQQLVVLTSLWGKTWQGNVILSLPLTLVCAYLSWSFVESPSMRLRIAAAAAFNLKFRQESASIWTPSS